MLRYQTRLCGPKLPFLYAPVAVASESAYPPRDQCLRETGPSLAAAPSSRGWCSRCVPRLPLIPRVWLPAVAWFRGGPGGENRHRRGAFGVAVMWMVSHLSYVKDVKMASVLWHQTLVRMREMLYQCVPFRADQRPVCIDFSVSAARGGDYAEGWAIAAPPGPRGGAGRDRPRGARGHVIRVTPSAGDAPPRPAPPLCRRRPLVIGLWPLRRLAADS